MPKRIHAAVLLLVLLLISAIPETKGAARTVPHRLTEDSFKAIIVPDRVVGTARRPPQKSPTTRLESPQTRAKSKAVSVPTSAKQYALRALGSTQYTCIDKIFRKESNWNPRAYNNHSGAYGIPQALPGSKMSTFGADWRTNPITQVRWGINYVNHRYGSACAALNFWNRNGWY